jgi:ABC-type multidrug transport system ATPase subunit
MSLVNGAIRSGELTCILGSSGAGKTTLLNTLTFQASSKLNFSGTRYLNGEVVSASLFASVSAYVQQQDLFVGTLTVREHLTFHALLRMHPNIPYERRMERVLEVIEEVS